MEEFQSFDRPIVSEIETEIPAVNAEDDDIDSKWTAGYVTQPGTPHEDHQGAGDDIS